MVRQSVDKIRCLDQAHTPSAFKRPSGRNAWSRSIACMSAGQSGFEFSRRGRGGYTTKPVITCKSGWRQLPCENTLGPLVFTTSFWCPFKGTGVDKKNKLASPCKRDPGSHTRLKTRLHLSGNIERRRKLIPHSGEGSFLDPPKAQPQTSAILGRLKLLHSLAWLAACEQLSHPREWQ